jgi:hypothetical protein
MAKIKTVLVSSIILSIVACTNTVPNNSNVQNSKENFQDLDKEYSFITKQLTSTYLRKKLDKWITEPNGANLVKEIAYGRYKYHDPLCTILTDDTELHAAIDIVPEIIARAVGDIPFAEFLENCVPDPVGEFKVNTFTTLEQSNPAMAMDSDGDFVVAWQSGSQTLNGPDGSLYGIYAQRYDKNGIAQGSEFKVNSFTNSNQINPAIAMDNDGDFVITWASFNQGGSSFDVFGQRYNSSGVAQGLEFQVNTFGTGNQNLPAVVMDRDGDFVVTWTSTNQDGDANFQANIYAKRYDKNGTALTGEIRVNTFTTDAQRSSSIAMDSNGNYVITWHSGATQFSPPGSIGQDGSNYGIYGQRYNSSGQTVGSEFKINSTTVLEQRFSTVVMDAAGDFVVTWQSGFSALSPPGSIGQDGSNYGIYGQRYGSNGGTVGNEFKINTTIASEQKNVAVAIDTNGDFIVTWQSKDQDGSNYGIYGQRYGSNGGTVGNEFKINTYTTNEQRLPAVAMDSGGDFVVMWQSKAQDLSGYGVYGKRYNKNGREQ